MQVLNDNHFNNADSYENIPWTDSLTKIFRWYNRLENHMGHFGSETYLNPKLLIEWLTANSEKLDDTDFQLV